MYEVRILYTGFHTKQDAHLVKWSTVKTTYLTDVITGYQKTEIDQTNTGKLTKTSYISIAWSEEEN